MKPAEAAKLLAGQLVTLSLKLSDRTSGFGQ